MHAGVISHLESEFNALAARRDPTPITLEPRLRNARYLAELAKFRCAAWHARAWQRPSFLAALQELLSLSLPCLPTCLPLLFSASSWM